MADEDLNKPRPNLEPPKLFGRKKAKPAAAAPAAKTPAPAAKKGVAPAPVVKAPVKKAPVRKAPVEAAPVTETPAARPAAKKSAPRPSSPATVPLATTPVVEPVAATLPAADDTTVFEDSSIRTAPKPTPRSPADTDPEPSTGGAGNGPSDTVPAERPGLVLAGRTAAAVTGLLVGGVMIGLIYLAFAGCEAVQGTTACGTAPGLGLLLVILALSVVAGAVVLGYFGIADPGSTSFLAVALVGVISMLFLVDVLDEWPMLIVIPLVSSFTFVLSWWVATTFTEPARD